MSTGDFLSRKDKKNDMKTHRHIEYILAICYKRIWAIRKLKKAGVPEKDILYFYFMKIRSVLESNCVVYHSMLTNDDTSDIERVQKIVLRIILEFKYTDYHQSCLHLNIQSLQIRRAKISLNFGLKCISSEKFKHLFSPNTNTTIRNPDQFDVPLARSSRYFNSPLLHITRLLNAHFRNLNSPVSSTIITTNEL